jgi:hypothetical protein
MARFETFIRDPLSVRLMHNRMDRMIPFNLRRSFLCYMMQQSAGRIRIDGPSLEVPIHLGPSANGTWFSFGDAIGVGGTANLAMGWITPRFAGFGMARSILQERMDENNPHAFFKAMRLQLLNFSWARARFMEEGVWNGSGGKAPDGIVRQIEKRVAASQTFAPFGAPKSTYPFLANGYIQLTKNVGALSSGTTIPAGILALDELIKRATVAGRKPDLVVTTQAVWDTLDRAFTEMTTVHRSITDQNAAKWGHTTFVFKGVTIGWDDLCPADTLYCLHVSDQVDTNFTGIQANQQPGVLDSALSRATHTDLLDLNGNLSTIVHSAFDGFTIDSNAGVAPNLSTVNYIIDSMNVFIPRPGHCSVAGSDNGSRWSTW